MLEVLQFIFSSFWIWLGTLLLVMGVAEAFAGLLATIFQRRK